MPRIAQVGDGREKQIGQHFAVAERCEECPRSPNTDTSNCPCRVGRTKNFAEGVAFELALMDD